MSEMAPPLGPSYLKELPLAPGDDRRVGLTAPQTMTDDLGEWWIALLWCERAGKLLRFRDLAPAQGIPAGSPLMRLGPGLSGALSGLIREESGRQQLRLRLGQPPADGEDPWQVPLTVLAAIGFEPARKATLRPSELAGTVLEAFREAVLRLSY